VKLSNADIIKALKTHRAKSPPEDFINAKTAVKIGTFKLTFKASQVACDAVIKKYEKNWKSPDFQKKLEWARNDTRNFKQRELKS